MDTKTAQPPIKRRRRTPLRHLDGMFAITTGAANARPEVVVVGCSSRKHATTSLNIPVSQEFKDQLKAHVVGSMAMGTGALLKWALQELGRQGISLEATPKR